MSRAAIQDQTGRNYDFPRNVQYSVFLENRCGKLLELIEIFDSQPIAIVGLSIMDTADHAVVRMITSNSGLARNLLKKSHFSFSESDVLVVEFSPRQTLTQMCMCLLSAEVNIHYAYPLMLHRGVHHSAIALRTEDYTLAGQILRRKLFNLLGEWDFQEPPPPDSLPESPPDPDAPGPMGTPDSPLLPDSPTPDSKPPRENWPPENS